jgi:ketosteroid isomerase-like protein
MDVVDFWTRSWINDDRLAVRQLLAPDAEIEWNLDSPVDDEELVQTLHRIAVFADSVTVVTQSAADDGAALIYELAAPFGTARMVEFLTVADGRITEVRQVYDVAATDRFLPGLYEQTGPAPYER